MLIAKMETESEKVMSSPDTLIEAKLSRVPKAFSIENLIAKKGSFETENVHLQHHTKVPPITFPQNFPFYNPWAANYLMSHANLPQNILQLNASTPPQPQLQNDKLANLVSDSQGFVYKDLLLNPLLHLSSHDQNNSTYHHHFHQQDPNMFTSKLKDSQFLNEFYTNYFMLENNRQLLSASSDNNAKRTNKKDYVMSENCNNDSNNSEFDVVNDGDDKVEHKSGIYYEEDSSYSDLSVTLSPEHVQKNLDKGNE
jgi:hypothetical protein